MLDVLIKHIQEFAPVVGTLLLAASGAFLNEWFKNRALKKENRNLLASQQKFALDLENLKMDNQLKLQKKAHQYKAKQEAYIAYFNELDKYNDKAISETYNQINELTTKFFASFLNSNGNRKLENNALTVFQSKVQKLLIESQKDYQHLKNSTNSIKIIASDYVLKQLEALEKGYDHLFGESNKAIERLPKLIINENDVLAKIQERLLELGEELQTIHKDKLILLVRKELSEAES